MLNINIIKKLENCLICLLKDMKIFKNLKDGFYYLKQENTLFVYYIDLVVNMREISKINKLNIFYSSKWSLLVNTFLNHEELIEYKNSEHFAIIFTSKYIKDYLYLYLFTHRLNSHADLNVLKQEVISNYDIFGTLKKQAMTNPIIKIPSDSVIFSDLNNQYLTTDIHNHKNDISNIMLKDNNYMFDIEDYINEFYLLNIDEFLLTI